MENVVNLMSRFGVADAHPAMDALRDTTEQPKIAVADSFSEKAEADWLASKIREAPARRSEQGGGCTASATTASPGNARYGPRQRRKHSSTRRSIAERLRPPFVAAHFG
ncbi:MAG TPA: hypothetical protein VJ925_02675 [Longimicrobiales bacterium]|nr:hypothetical protein [Longimicrobiales bacterium]